ncbi:TRAG family protein [Bacillus pseudomycoides]|nr:TRAG family protein [Bacillus pseudomycoides]PGA67891.1 TRAG family protein [Bacillus pseudomycoides]PHE94759.1 TRAG family protein [Bacillus pseudomycoides]
MSGVYIGTTKQSFILKEPMVRSRSNAWTGGKLGNEKMHCKGDWLSEDLMQAISIAQTVVKPKERYDFWIESATKLLAGSILYLDQKHKNLYYLDVKKVIEFTGKIYESEANLIEVVRSLENEHPAYPIFHELGLYSKETRDATIITLLYILEKHQREKNGEEKEYFWFQY